MESEYDLTYGQKLRTIIIKVKWPLSLTIWDMRNLRNDENTDAHIKIDNYWGSPTKYLCCIILNSNVMLLTEI